MTSPQTRGQRTPWIPRNAECVLRSIQSAPNLTSKWQEKCYAKSRVETTVLEVKEESLWNAQWSALQFHTLTSLTLDAFYLALFPSSSLPYVLPPLLIAHLLRRTISLRAHHSYLLKTYISCDHLNEAVTTARGLIFGILMCWEGKHQSFHAVVSTEWHACVVLGTVPHLISQRPAGRLTLTLVPARLFAHTARLACLFRDWQQEVQLLHRRTSNDLDILRAELFL